MREIKQKTRVFSRVSKCRITDLTAVVVAISAALGVIAAASGHAAFAQNAQTPRVARLTLTEGYVYIDRTGNTAGDPAQLNMPLVEGQTVATGDDGQAEIEFEDGSVARLTPNTILNFTRMAVNGSGSSSTQLGLIKGLAYFELRSASRFAYTVNAGGDLISPAENTTFRINLDEPPAAIAVLDGTTNVERDGQYKTDLHAGETFRSDTEDPGRYFLTQEVAPDTWDQWNESRDQAAADTAATQTTARDGYAGNQGYGWSDLDANGNWYSVAGQGQVWQPNGGADASFDPYGNGSWTWYTGTGYTWASGYSWGWTPYRCGAWSYWNSFGWGWSPNAACGGFGFAGYGGYGYGGYGGGYGHGYGSYGGGYGNIVRPPPHYPIQRLPVTALGGVHPIITVRRTASGTPPGGPVDVQPSTPGQSFAQSGQLLAPRHIAGVAATPLQRFGQAYTSRGGSAVGASLRRDFPVDRATRTPVLGLQPTHSAVQTGFVTQGLPATQRGGQTYGSERPGVARPGSPQGIGTTRPGVQQPGGQRVLRPFNQPGAQQGIRTYNPQVPPPGNQPGGQVNRGGYIRPGGTPPPQPSSPRQSAPGSSVPAASHFSYSAPSAGASHTASPSTSPSGSAAKH